MIKQLTYSDINPQQWQALVEQSPYATWFQTPEAYEFYAAVSGELIPFAFGVEEYEGDEAMRRSGDEAKGRLVGVIVGYTTKCTNAIQQYFTKRAIIYGGPLLDVGISNDALSTLLKTVVQNIALNPIYIETRNFNDYSRWKDIFDINGFNYQKHLDYHINTTSLELAQSNIGKHRWRYIRLSMRDGQRSWRIQLSSKCRRSILSCKTSIAPKCEPRYGHGSSLSDYTMWSMPDISS